MTKLKPDTDRFQRIKDIWFSRNRYRLDTRFVLRDGKKHLLALICPGGAYRKVCSYIEGVPIARRLNALDISAVILYYRVREKGAFPAPQDDLARAVRDILNDREAFPVETAGYSVWGFSAGGHLAAGFGTTSLGYRHYALPSPGAIILAYPVISMKQALAHSATRETLLGCNPQDDLVNVTSIDTQVDTAYPPAYLWCGDADESVPPENTLLMKQALLHSGVPCLCEIFPGVSHGVGPGTGTAAEGWIEHAAAFWKQQLAHHSCSGPGL